MQKKSDDPTHPHRDGYPCSVKQPSPSLLVEQNTPNVNRWLQVIIAGTTRAIANLEDKSWRNVVAMLNQNPLLEPHEDEIYRVDQFIKAGTNAFKFPGIADGAVIREVEAWFANLISGVCSTMSKHVRLLPPCVRVCNSLHDT